MTFLASAYKTDKGVRVELSEMLYLISNSIRPKDSRVIGRLATAKERQSIGLR